MASLGKNAYLRAVPVQENFPMTANSPPVPLAGALYRGFSGRCPSCGKGRLFGRFLKVADRCCECDEEFFHHRADDFPPYLVIVAIGHVVVPLLVAVEIAFAPPLWLQYAIWLPVIVIGALLLIQPAKGAVVALQWHLGMHGFEEAKRRRDGEAAVCLRQTAP